MCDDANSSSSQGVDGIDMTDRPLGIVVVGLGIAGKVRVRDLKQKILGDTVVLRGVISRRQVEDDLPVLHWDEALTRDDVDAFIICTENDTHEEYARKILEHGKHVLVDFPLSLTAESGKNIFDLAESQGLTCHVEDIALLLDSHKDMKQTIQNKTVPLIEGSIRLDARFLKEWIADLSRAGFPSFSGISQLEILYDLFGELSLKEAHFVHEPDLQLLTCKLHTSDSRPIIWRIERVRGGKPRQASQEYKFEDGSTVTPAPVSKPPGPPPPGHKGLFARDLEIFLSEIRGERSSDDIAQDKKRVLYCLELAEKIEKMAKTGTSCS